MARLYANENFPLPVVEHLRTRGHDVVTVAETGKAGQSWTDDAVLEWATNESRIVLTFNRKHFLRLHYVRPGHAGVIACTIDLDSAGLADRIDAVLQNPSVLSGEFVRINRPNRG